MNPDCKYIVAGNFIQAADYAYSHELRDWYYVRDADWLRGRTIAEDQIVYTGTYYERHDLAAIRDNLLFCMRMVTK